MPIRRRLSVSLGCVLAVSLAEPAWATLDNFKSFKQAYPGKDAKAYSCKICHQGAVGKKGDLNAYGAALQTFKAEQGAKKLTVEDYKALDEADADEDGATNLQEWEAGTNWADPKSVPAGVAPIKKNDVEESPPHSSRQSPDAAGQLQAYLSRLVAPEAWA
ncbi:MAG: hypothetical protein HYY91_00295, partial [Candidatus Omnitrophica bacterium]|nr:hypothetical protein [Candidatus Omnitrophota bacterium]